MNFFLRFFQPSSPPEDYADPVLGTLRWSPDEDGWVALVPSFQGRVSLVIAGERQPDSQLLAHARELAQAPTALQALVSEALEDEARSFDTYYRDEIRSLTLETIYLFWPKRPDDGMLYLPGGRAGRVWRFDYLARRPAGLGFDS